MTWIPDPTGTGHLTDAACHFNRSLDLQSTGASYVDVSRSLFDALNKVQTEWVRRDCAQRPGEVKGFQMLVTNELDATGRSDILRSDELRDFVRLEPQVMNHDTLTAARYDPERIEPSLRKKASEEHRGLVTAYQEFQTERTSELEERVLKRAAELLYVIRSNIAHGEKPHTVRTM
jgi:hypothetical protein